MIYYFEKGSTFTKQQIQQQIPIDQLYFYLPAAMSSVIPDLLHL